MADKVPEQPDDWKNIPMGPGQDPPRPNAHLQHSDIRGPREDVRREPGYEHFTVVHRFPERPA